MTDGKYKTVYLEDLCSELSNNPDALLLDVRTSGEYNDTSSIPQLNIGRFKNSVNMDTEKFEDLLPVLNPPKDKKIYVYCSHSNRSRACSEYLIEQGYTDVNNVNGGISEWILEDMDCRNGNYTTALPYKLYSPGKVKDMIEKDNVQLIDVRPKDEYEGKSADEQKNAGRIKNSINIPFDELENRISEIDRNKDIILCDFDCKTSPSAAKLLAGKGFTNTGVLIFGLTSWINMTNSAENNLMENLPAYKNLSIDESARLLMNNNDIIILDIRPVKDFNNNNDMTMMRIGHLKNAINIPAAEFDRRAGEVSGFKGKKVLVYDNLSTGKSAEVCKKLYQSGFKDVNNIFCGLYKIVWSKLNLKGFSFPEALIVK